MLRDFEPLVQKISALEGVSGVTPFIDADVMLASQTNIAAVLLKGVDPQTMDKVISLKQTMEQGDLRYLNAPESILPDVLAEQERRLKLLLADSGIGGADSGFREDGGDDAQDAGFEFSPPPPLAPPINDMEPEKGRNEVLPAVIVGRELAKTLRIFVGDEVNVVSPLGGMGPLGPIPKSRPYRIGGVFYSGMYQDDAKNAYVKLDVAQRFLGMEDRISGLRIRVEEIEDAPEIAETIHGIIGNQYRVRPWNVVNANLFSALALEKIAMFALYLIFFIICAFLIASTLTMMVLEKRHSIAVLKTLGASNRRLGMIFMLQGMLAGFAGTLSGQISSFLQCLALAEFVKIDPQVYYIERLPIAMEPMEFATVAALSLLTAAAATVLPLGATVVLRPVDGLRL